jgi:hypothetical protein
LGLDDSFCEGGFACAVNANCGEFDDLFSQGDQIINISESFSLERSIEGGN